jgi:hypothetical protein
MNRTAATSKAKQQATIAAGAREMSSLQRMGKLAIADGQLVRSVILSIRER